MTVFRSTAPCAIYGALQAAMVRWADYGASTAAGDAVLCPSCAAACQARVDAGLLMQDVALLGGAHRDGEAIGSIIANDVAAAPFPSRSGYKSSSSQPEATCEDLCEGCV